MRTPAPTTPPTIAPVFDRFEATGTLAALLDVPAGIKAVCTTSFVDVVWEEVSRDVD